MKLAPTLLSLLLVLSFCSVTYGQNTKLTTIHIYASTQGGLQLRSPLSPSETIKLGGLTSNTYTVIETDTNVLQLKFTRTSARIIDIPFEAGRSYYYQVIGPSHVPVTVKEITEREFLLLTCFEATSYRRYSITKAGGVKLLEEE